jgi:hypothetical protein
MPGLSAWRIHYEHDIFDGRIVPSGCKVRRQHLERSGPGDIGHQVRVAENGTSDRNQCGAASQRHLPGIGQRTANASFNGADVDLFACHMARDDALDVKQGGRLNCPRRRKTVYEFHEPMITDPSSHF